MKKWGCCAATACIGIELGDRTADRSGLLERRRVMRSSCDQASKGSDKAGLLRRYILSPIRQQIETCIVMRACRSTLV
jgi:hypothetical protein